MIKRIAWIFIAVVTVGLAGAWLAARAGDLGPGNPTTTSRSPSRAAAAAHDEDVRAVASAAYARGDFPEAEAIASRYLTGHPDDVRMLRIRVSASCITGDQLAARRSYAKLPADEQAQLRPRCARYGVSLADTP